MSNVLSYGMLKVALATFEYGMLKVALATFENGLDGSMMS